ncbi:DUF6328 family protein [Nocardioides sp. TRM66260-LWL]|uniref:DUF6328 family protein n=1 Tax=Nocardioides sp. TRM66260-LWL TaxID=2874478 RepID=UPI001CC659FA|nr:DUF6328 family protein [Nocardioides sp. TRM66260-LWL]MBZ5733934.1 DUF6328 family protein [Nocardioides sp. TRM66260-LWL]
MQSDGPPTDPAHLDRQFEDLLQELRVAQTGAQLLAGILVTLPFQPAFGRLDGFERSIYLLLVGAALLTTLAVLTPIAVHRRLSGRHHKQDVVHTARRALDVALACLCVLVAGIATLVVDVVVGRQAGLVSGAVVAALALVVLVVTPRRLV